MNTVDRIISASIERFNAEGISNVSLRGIAEEVGISHGNLAYHFANKGAILKEIYSLMEAEMADAVYPPGELTLRHYYRLLIRLSAFRERYRFFYMDILEITRKYPTVIRRYRNAVARRFEEHDRLMANFISKKLFRPEPVNGFYQSLFRSIWVMSTFWQQHQMVLGDNHPAMDAGSDVLHVWEIMGPHLTAKGWRELKAIQEETKCSDLTLYLDIVEKG